MCNLGFVMKILALDTSTDACSAACDNDGEIASRCVVTPHGHAGLILGMIRDVLDSTGTALKDLDFIACGRGPGSFTGVRIGVSVAEGLAFGLGLKIAPVSDLAAQAEREFVENPDAETVIIANDARMKEVYAAVFRRENGSLTEAMPESVLSPEDAVKKFTALSGDGGRFVLAGSGFSAYAPLQDFASGRKLSKALYPDSGCILRLAARMAEDGKLLLPDQVVPSYVRNEVAWKKVGEQGKQHQA